MADDDEFAPLSLGETAVGFGGLGEIAGVAEEVASTGESRGTTVTYHFPVEIEVVRETVSIDHTEIADAVLAMLANHLRRV